MGLKGAGGFKKLWSKMGGRVPDDKIQQAREMADFAVGDGTGEFYDRVTNSTSFIGIAGAADNFLQEKKAKLPNCNRLYCTLDVESLKPASKRVLREESTKGHQPMDDANVRKFLEFCPFDADDEQISEKMDYLAPRLYQHDVEHGLAKPGGDPYKYLVNRMLRTHALRNLLFKRFVRGMQADMEGPTPSFRFVVIDGYPDVEVRDGVASVTHMVLDMKLKDEDGVLKCTVEKKPLVQRVSGEADIRAVKVADGLLKRGFANMVYLSTRDTDLVPILLMTCRSLGPRRDVLIDLGPGSRDGPDDVFSIHHLSCGVYSWMKEEFPESVGNQSNALTMLCAVMVLGGTDFVEKPPGVGFERLWKYFLDIGHAFFRGFELPPLRAGEEFVRSWSTVFARRARAFAKGLLATDSSPSKALMQRHVRYKSMVERRIEAHGGPQKAIKKRTVQATRAHLMGCVGKWSDVMEEAKPRTSVRSGIMPQPMEWIEVYISQAAWNLLYWNFAEVDSLMRSGQRACWGWETGEDGAIIRASQVAPWNGRWQESANARIEKK